MKTIKQQQRLQSLRKQELISQAVESGVVDKVNKLLSAIYLLNSHVAVLYGDAEDILKEQGLELGAIKYKGEKVGQALDSYFRTYSKEIGWEQTENWANDYEYFKDMFNRFAGISSDVLQQ